jgi:hypothetical protein
MTVKQTCVASSGCRHSSGLLHGREIFMPNMDFSFRFELNKRAVVPRDADWEPSMEPQSDYSLPPVGFGGRTV